MPQLSWLSINHPESSPTCSTCPTYVPGTYVDRCVSIRLISICTQRDLAKSCSSIKSTVLMCRWHATALTEPTLQSVNFLFIFILQLAVLRRSRTIIVRSVSIEISLQDIYLPPENTVWLKTSWWSKGCTNTDTGVWIKIQEKIKYRVSASNIRYRFSFPYFINTTKSKCVDVKSFCRETTFSLTANSFFGFEYQCILKHQESVSEVKKKAGFHYLSKSTVTTGHIKVRVVLWSQRSCFILSTLPLMFSVKFVMKL